MPDSLLKTALQAFQPREIWLALFMYAAVMMGWKLYLAKLTDGGMLGGCASPVVGALLQQILFLPLLMTYLTPSALGLGTVAPLPLGTDWFTVYLTAGIAIATIAFAVSLIPFAGPLLTRTPGLDIFIGGYVLLRLAGDRILAHLGRADLVGSLHLPAPKVAAGFLALALLLSQLPMLLARLYIRLTINYQYEFEQKLEMAEIFIGSTLGLAGGILGYFIFAAHIRRALGL